MDKVNVLIVDDNKELARGLQRLLDRSGFSTASAYGVEEAMSTIQFLCGCGIKVDFVLSDIDMPDGTGFDLYDRTHRVLESPPTFLFMSAWVSARKELEAKKREVEILDKIDPLAITQTVAMAIRS